MSIKRTNQIWNPGFETPVDPAILGSPSSSGYFTNVTEDPTVKYSGNQSLKIVNNGSAGGLCYQQIDAGDYIRVPAGGSLIASMRAKRSDVSGSNEGWQMYANVYKQSDASSYGALGGPTLFFTGSEPGWTKMTMTGFRFTTDVYMILYFLSFGSQTGTTFNIDECITEVCADADAYYGDTTEYPFFSGSTPSAMDKLRSWSNGTQAGPSVELIPTYTSGDKTPPQTGGTGKLLMPIQESTVTRAQPVRSGLRLTPADQIQNADASNGFLNGTDQIDFRVRLRLGLLSNDSTQYVIASKWTGGSDGSWWFALIGNAPYFYQIPTNGGGANNLGPNIAVPAFSGRDQWLRMVVDFKTAKTSTWYSSFDGVNWAALGVPQALNTDAQTGIRPSTTVPLQVGQNTVSAASNNLGFLGTLRKMICINTSAGVSTTKQIDFTRNKVGGAFPIKDTEGRVWAVTAGAPAIVEDIA